MNPKVLVFTAVSADGYTEGFDVDQTAFYNDVQRKSEDVVLAGSNTILAVPGAEPDPDTAPDLSQFRDGGPLLAVIDSQGRIKVWDWLRRQPHWRDVIVIGSEGTPGSAPPMGPARPAPNYLLPEKG
jgi:2,5-diamino-6-(ribosylamino)-4(3H)-pyrimidinone 5'-phosphate reductase